MTRVKEHGRWALPVTGLLALLLVFAALAWPPGRSLAGEEPAPADTPKPAAKEAPADAPKPAAKEAPAAESNVLLSGMADVPQVLGGKIAFAKEAFPVNATRKQEEFAGFLGRAGPIRCDRCGGKGKITIRTTTGGSSLGGMTYPSTEEHEERCPLCAGQGTYYDLKFPRRLITVVDILAHVKRSGHFAEQRQQAERAIQALFAARRLDKATNAWVPVLPVLAAEWAKDRRTGAKGQAVALTGQVLQAEQHGPWLYYSMCTRDARPPQADTVVAAFRTGSTDADQIGLESTEGEAAPRTFEAGSEPTVLVGGLFLGRWTGPGAADDPGGGLPVVLSIVCVAKR